MGVRAQNVPPVPVITNVLGTRMVDGVPNTGKITAEALATQLLGTSPIAALVAAGAFKPFANLAAMTNLYPADAIGWVYNDATADNNGIYRKSGSSGSGAWSKILPLPGSFAKAAYTGEGTVDIIQAASDITIHEGVLVALDIEGPNTASPVTVAFNGGSALTIKTASGANVPVGALVSGVGVVSGSTFRMLSDLASSAIQSAAAASAASAASAKTASEAARDAAVAAMDGKVDVSDKANFSDPLTLDEAAEPTEAVGKVKFFLDSADGKLKVKFEDGSVRAFNLDPPVWVPNGASMMIDFANSRYWDEDDGLIANPVALSRSTSAWRTANDGKTITEYAANTLRRDGRGAMIEGYDRTRLSYYPVTPASWTNFGSPTITRSTLSADGAFTPQLLTRPSSGASNNAIKDAASGWAITSGAQLSIRSLLKAGTSGRSRVVLRRNGDNAVVSAMTGAIGSLSSSNTSLGTMTAYAQTEIGDLRESKVTLTAASSQSDVDYELGPDAASDGGNVTVYGGQVTVERYPGEWILGTPSSGFAQDDDKATVAAEGIKTISADFTLLSYASGGTLPVIWHYGDASSYVRLVYEVSSGKLLAQVYSAGVQQCSLDLGVVTIGARHVVAFHWANNDFAASIDGGADVTDTSGTAPTSMTSLHLAQDSANANGAAVLFDSLILFDTAVAV